MTKRGYTVTVAHMRASAACLNPRTLETWPRERLDLLWQLVAQAKYPMYIAKALNAAHPSLPRITHPMVYDFILQRGIRRGDPVPDPEVRFDCYLYRDLPPPPPDPPAALPVDVPAAPRARVTEFSDLPWPGIVDWARRDGLRRADGQSDDDWLRTAINPRRIGYGLPPFRRIEAKPWQPRWRGWSSVAIPTEDYRKPASL